VGRPFCLPFIIFLSVTMLAKNRCTANKKVTSRLLEIALVLVRFNHVHCIENANHSIM
jgi:hypothetical protein